MLLRLWQNMQLLENTLRDNNAYRMYSSLVTGGVNFTAIPPDGNLNGDQAMLDIDKVRILSMSHKYDPTRVHVGLLIYSVDGQTDFILNDVQLRIKTGDILVHRVHHVLAGEEDLYKDLIRTLFGTHRINLVGLVFTFTGNGQFSDCMRWIPTSANHLTPMHPLEQKLLEIVLVSLYMNHAWLTMPMASHVDAETLSQSAKKQYLLKLGETEQLFNERRKQYQHQTGVQNIFRRQSHHSDSFRSFEWTPSRQLTFDQTMQRLLDEFYNLIYQVLPTGEFDRDQYAYYDDSTRQAVSNLPNPYERLQMQPRQNYFTPQQRTLL